MLAGRHRFIGEPFFERVHLRFHVEQRLKGGGGFVEQGVTGVREAVLRQIADRQAVRLDDQAGVRLVHPGEHLEQRGLAGAVRAAEADPFARADLPGHTVEQDTLAKRLAELGELDH